MHGGGKKCQHTECVREVVGTTDLCSLHTCPSCQGDKRQAFQYCGNDVCNNRPNQNGLSAGNHPRPGASPPASGVVAAAAAAAQSGQSPASRGATLRFSPEDAFLPPIGQGLGEVGYGGTGGPREASKNQPLGITATGQSRHGRAPAFSIGNNPADVAQACECSIQPICAQPRWQVHPRRICTRGKWQPMVAEHQAVDGLVLQLQPVLNHRAHFQVMGHPAVIMCD